MTAVANSKATHFPDMPASVYHGYTEWISKTNLAMFVDCPIKYKQFIDGQFERQESQRMRLGTAAHAYGLEYEKFCQMYHVLPPGMARRKNDKAYQAEVEKAGTKTIINEHELAQVISIDRAISLNPRTKTLLAGKPLIEASIFWIDDDGMKKKCRPDVLRIEDDIVIDLKITESATPDSFFATAARFHYALSVALTAEGYKAAFGRELADYVLVAVEVDPPNIIECYSTFESAGESSYLEIGREQLAEAVSQLRECVRTDRWPSYTDAVLPMRMPKWARRN